MSMVKMAGMLSMVAIVILPLSVWGQGTPSPVMAPVIPESEVRQFMDQYVERFKAMDLEAFMALFSKEAIENRSLPYPDIVQAYRRFFEPTNQLTYQLRIRSIQTYTNSAFVMGQYEIVQTLKERSKVNTYRGNIQWELIREDGGLKVFRINYGREE